MKCQYNFLHNLETGERPGDSWRTAGILTNLFILIYDPISSICHMLQKQMPTLQNAETTAVKMLKCPHGSQNMAEENTSVFLRTFKLHSVNITGHLKCRHNDLLLFFHKYVFYYGQGWPY